MIPTVIELVNISRLFPIKILPLITITGYKRINNISLYQITNKLTP